MVIQRAEWPGCAVMSIDNMSMNDISSRLMADDALSPIACEVLLSLVDGPRHGYAIKLDIEARTNGEVSLGSGTLYQAIQRLERDGLIDEAHVPGGRTDARRGRSVQASAGGAGRPAHLPAAPRAHDRLRPSAPSAAEWQIVTGRTGERRFRALLLLYPRAFRDRYGDDLLAFFREDRRHPRYGSGVLRPVRFWMATVHDLVRTAWRARVQREHDSRPAGRGLTGAGHRLSADVRDGWRSLRLAPGVTAAALVVTHAGNRRRHRDFLGRRCRGSAGPAICRRRPPRVCRRNQPPVRRPARHRRVAQLRRLAHAPGRVQRDGRVGARRRDHDRGRGAGRALARRPPDRVALRCAAGVAWHSVAGLPVAMKRLERRAWRF